MSTSKNRKLLDETSEIMRVFSYHPSAFSKNKGLDKTPSYS